MQAPSPKCLRSEKIITKCATVTGQCSLGLNQTQVRCWLTTWQEWDPGLSKSRILICKRGKEHPPTLCGGSNAPQLRAGQPMKKGTGRGQCSKDNPHCPHFPDEDSETLGGDPQPRARLSLSWGLEPSHSSFRVTPGCRLRAHQ